MHLQIKKFLEFHPLPSFLKSVGSLRKMKIDDCLPHRHQTIGRHHFGRERIGNCLKTRMLQQILYQRTYIPDRKAVLAAGFRQGVDSTKSRRGIFRIELRHLRMGHRPDIPEK